MWVLIAGDDEGSLTLNGVNRPEVNVLGLKAGDYTFELTVLDGLGQADTDTVDIVVTGARKVFIGYALCGPIQYRQSTYSTASLY